MPPSAFAPTTSEAESLVSGYDSPEGPCFSPDGRSLFFVNWLTSSILRVSPDGQASEFTNTGGIPAGLAFDREGTLYVADEGDQWHGVLKVSPDGTIVPWIQEYQGTPLNGANDLVFDAQGVLYFSDPWRSSRENSIGGFYRAFPDGRLEQLDTGLAFPNGVAVAPDGSAVFLAETGHNRVLRYAVSPDGTVGPRTEWAQLEDGPGPDGMAFDADGSLYVAHYGASRVDVLDPSGRVTRHIPIPGLGVTNVAFGGPNGRTVIVTEVETGTVYRLRNPVPGQPLFAGPSW